jgi:hypothetical protein
MLSKSRLRKLLHILWLVSLAFPAGCSPAYLDLEACTSGSLRDGIRIHFTDELGRSLKARVRSVSVSSVKGTAWLSEGRADVASVEYGKSPQGMETKMGPAQLEVEVAYRWSVHADGSWWGKDRVGGDLVYMRTGDEFGTNCKYGILPEQLPLEEPE